VSGQTNKHTAEKLTNVAHYCAGFAVLMKGIDKAAHFGEHPVGTSVILFAGAFIFVGAALHPKLKGLVREPKGLFQMAEGVALLAAAWVLHGMGSARMPSLYAFLALCFLALGVFFWFVPEETRPRVMHRFQIAYGAALIVGAAVFATSLVINGTGFWMRLIEAILLGAGVGLVTYGLLRRRRLALATASSTAPAPAP
jgi:hypothetical protein